MGFINNIKNKFKKKKPNDYRNISSESWAVVRPDKLGNKTKKFASAKFAIHHAKTHNKKYPDRAVGLYDTKYGKVLKEY